MPRDMSSAMETAVASDQIFPAIFLEATFATGPIYVWTGYGTINWGGHDWLGIGTLGGISPIEEGSTVNARNVTLTLSGIDATLLADVLGEFRLGAPVIIHLGFFDSTTGTLMASPVVAWAGMMDQPTIDASASTAIISIACESRLILMNVIANFRYTNEQQQLDHPGDRGCEFVMGLVEATLYFGATPNSSNNL